MFYIKCLSKICSWLPWWLPMPVWQGMSPKAMREPVLLEKPMRCQRRVLPIQPQSTMQMSSWLRRKPTHKVWNERLQVRLWMPIRQSLRGPPMRQPVPVQQRLCTERWLFRPDPPPAMQVSIWLSWQPEGVLQKAWTRSPARVFHRPWLSAWASLHRLKLQKPLLYPEPLSPLCPVSSYWHFPNQNYDLYLPVWYNWRWVLPVWWVDFRGRRLVSESYIAPLRDSL
jgi:hypothetical protein